MIKTGELTTGSPCAYCGAKSVGIGPNLEPLCTAHICTGPLPKTAACKPCAEGAKHCKILDYGIPDLSAKIIK